MHHIDSSLDRAGNWFLTSGIQDQSGGFARYYRSDQCKNALVSTEITGYAISALVYMFRSRSDERYLDAAKRAATFLTRTAWDSGAATFPFEHSSNSAQPHALTYFFDSGIIVRGLLTLWREWNNDELLELARLGGLAMGHDFRGEHAIHPILNLPSKTPLPYEAAWSRSPGCYQLKSAMAWHDLSRLTGDAEFQEWYEAALEEAIRSESGFLPDVQGPERTMDRLHAYCYMLEGMMPAADRGDCQAKLAAGIQKVSTYLRSISPVFERSDVSAQLLRARLYAERWAGIELDEEEAADEATRMQSFQIKDADPRIDGGYCFGCKGAAMTPFVNPVSTAFSMQAHAMWEARKTGEPELDTLSLI